MRRLGQFKTASHRAALEEHLALSPDERLEASWRLYESLRLIQGESPSCRGILDLYEDARRLGLCES